MTRSVVLSRPPSAAALDLIRQDPEQQPTRQMGGRGPAQVVAPLQAKPICVEISEARDQIVEGRCLVRSLRRRRGDSAGATRMSAHWHHAARRTLDFTWRWTFFEGVSESACATSE